MEAAWAIGAGAGLAGLAGFRAFIPLAVYIFMARMGWAWGFIVDDNPMDFIISDVAAIVLLILVVLEVLMTRVMALISFEKVLRLPLSVAAGALVASAAMAGEFPGAAHFAGIAIGAIMALIGAYVLRGLAMLGEGRDPGPALDISILILSVLMMLVPPAGYILALLFVYLAARVRRLRKLKYKGLRVLA
jgi:hypothetical protein